MAIINILDKHTAELIAAGEVVERPSSVVKELCENAIDAGATNIVVTIEKGGISLIEISDNGSGIESEYIKTAFIRHATSKIQNEDDLNNINTLGFRGEALASIASVAKITLTTKTAQDEFASAYHICGGEEISMQEAARPVGTTISVKDLFYNTPARIKFLKKDVSEANFVSETVSRLALSHPEISFTFIREGKKQFQTPGDGNLKATAYEIISRDFAKDLIQISDKNEHYSISGFITPPISSRASRAMQFFFVNGRYVKNNTMMAALEAAYKGTLMQKKFPGCLLFLNLPSGLVDVNVHPAKTQIRFANERDVFNIVYSGVKAGVLSVKNEMKNFALSENLSKQTALSQQQNSEEVKTSEKFMLAAHKNDSEKPENNNTILINNDNLPQSGQESQSQQAQNLRKGFNLKPHSVDIFPDDIKPLPTVGELLPLDDEDMVLRQEDIIAYKNKISEEKNTWRNALKNGETQSAQTGENGENSENCENAENSENSENSVYFKNGKNNEIAENNGCFENGENSEHFEKSENIYNSVNFKNAETNAKNSNEDTLCNINKQAQNNNANNLQSPEVFNNEQLNFENNELTLKVVGEIFNTYIITQHGDDMCLIDKHAAHERIIYEKLLAQAQNPGSQILMLPINVTLSAAEKNAVMQYAQLIADIGIIAEDFGKNEIIIRALPMDITPEDAGELLCEIANKLLQNPRQTQSDKMQWVMHSVACRAAIKGGDKTPLNSLLSLCEDVLNGKIPLFCPHGRPVVLKLTKKEIEKQFGR